MLRHPCFLLPLLVAGALFVGAQTQAPPPPVGGITVDQVIRLSYSGLSDNAIVAQIKKRPQPFNLSPDELIKLKNAKVSERVIEAMSGPAPLLAITTGSSAPAPRPTLKVSLPTEPGMYIASGTGNTKIIGQVIAFDRTGSLLVSHITLGVKAAHVNVQLPGPHASVAVDGQPVFYFIPARQQADAGVDAGDLVLIQLEEKPHRRQFEVGARGDWRASEGISITHQIALARTEEASGVYKVHPANPLPKGEYAIYLMRGDGLKAYVYDFSSSGEHTQ